MFSNLTVLDVFDRFQLLHCLAMLVVSKQISPELKCFRMNLVDKKKTLVKLLKVPVWFQKNFPSRFYRVFRIFDVIDQRANSVPLS